MAIIYDEDRKVFSLNTKNTTYQLQADKYGFLLHLYYGRSAKGCMDYLLTYADRGFSGNPYEAGTDRTYSMDALPQEFPCRGNGDYRSAALTVRNQDGTYSCDLRYQGYEIIKGKYALKGLPAVYADEREAETLKVLLEDRVTGLQAVLFYGVIPKLDVITRSVEIINAGTKEIYLENVQPACLDFVSGSFDIISFYGRHAMERNFQRAKVPHGSFCIGSLRGTSSHQYSPFMVLADSSTTEDTGSCYAMNFVYSGSFKGEVLKDQYNQTRMMMGLSDEMFSYPLAPGECFYAPEVILTYTDQGLNRMSQNLHRLIRHHICRGKYKAAVRPVLINSWEAAYFDFTGDTILKLAKEAKDCGIEMVVMDDGWFGKRDDDYSGLGDWVVNEKKLGRSLGDLTRKVNDMGVKFGIWIEPEMISEDSDLYRAHPDWAFVIPGRQPNRARHQLVLDFSRREVVDAIFEQICSILDQGNIEYLKWDMNRSITDVYSAATKDQGRVLYDYVLGLYDFLERLTSRYPDMLIEGCSGGGGRFDAGMMYYTPQIWCSDNTDAADRLKIQYGSSFGFPVSAVGSHVSAVPNHQTGRTVSMRTRGVTAMAGTFGYELDLGKLSEEEKEEIRQQAALYKEYAPLIQNGTYYRLSNPFEDEAAAWEFASEDKSHILLNVVMLEIHGNMTVNYIKPRGLHGEAMYRDVKTGRVYNGAALMEAGLPLPVEMGEYLAYQIELVEVI